MKIQMANPSQEPPASSKAPNEDLKDLDVLCPYKIKMESQNLDLGCIKDQWPYPNQDEDAQTKSGTSSILPSHKWGLKRSWMFCAPSKPRKRVKIWFMGVSKTSDHIQIFIKMPNPSQETPASSKAPKKNLNDMDILCTFPTRNIQCSPKPKMRT